MPCSFCRKETHHIRNCDSQDIIVIYENMKHIFKDNYNSGLTNNENIYNFTIIAKTRFMLGELKAVCVKYINTSASLGKEAYIEFIWRWFHTDEFIWGWFHVDEFVFEDTPSLGLGLGLGLNISPRGITDIVQTKVQQYDIKLNINNCELTEENCHDCAICYEETTNDNIAVLNCGHKFCGMCIKNTLDYIETPSCALCRNNMSTITVHNLVTYNLISR